MTEWADAISIPNQTASQITEELTKAFSCYGIPQVLHSDQGRNFESILSCYRPLKPLIRINKSHTAAYHPADDELVERFNRSLLHMLCAYIQQHSDWEQYLPLVLYAYINAIHSSTSVLPFELMFGRCAHKPPLLTRRMHDVISYQGQLQANLA